jgi:geranylgeranyl reductase family protein
VITDTAIVGGGPAGSFAAYTLARAGARVAIFDPSHPREKPCGGGVTGRALALAADALGGVFSAASVINCARFLDPAAKAALVPLTHLDLPESSSSLDTAALIVASRAAFDAALLASAQQAGAVLVRARVTDVAIEPGCAVVQTAEGPCRARFLVGADGVNSLVRRRLARPFRREDLSIATGYFAHGVTSNEIVIEMMDRPDGYLWSFPRPDHLAIGGCVQADSGRAASALRAATAAWIRRTGLGEGARLEAYSWPIPSLTPQTLARLELCGPNWCLVGDAAGLVDPITREGIYFALLSGRWAAEAALSGDAAGYAARVRSEIIPELVRAARFKNSFFRVAADGLLLEALRESTLINRIMADLIAGNQSYAGLKWRLLKTLEWRLAGRSLLRVRRIRHAPGREGRVARRSHQGLAIGGRRSPAETAYSQADTETEALAPER